MTKILVVDDSKSVHAFLKDCLARAKVELVHAHNGQDAINQFPSLKESVNLILLDWEMPVLDGPATFREIRKKDTTIPIIMMTSRNSLDDITNMIDAGAAEYIMKPFTKDILLEKIESVLGTSIT